MPNHPTTGAGRLWAATVVLASAAALALCAMPALAGTNTEEAVDAAQDFFAKMSARDLAGVSRYIPAEGFTEIVPETDKLLQLDAKAFAGLFQSGRKIALRVVDLQTTAAGDTVIVTGKRVGYVAGPDATAVPPDSRLAFSMVWTKQASAWQLHHIHLSSIAASKP